MLHHLKAVWTFRHFWMSLVRMDLRSRYRRSVLGIGWSVLHPIAMSAVFCLVLGQIMDIANDNLWSGYPAPWRAYGAFLLCGMAVWEFIRNSTSMGCHALIHNEAYIRQCPLPYGIYPLRTVMGTTIHFLITMAVTVVLICLLKGSFEPFQVLWAVLPVFILLFIFCWSLATLAAFATAYFHDTAHLVEVGAQLMFFLTPIMYHEDKLGAFKWVASINPVNLFIELIRTPLVFNQLAPTDYYIQAVSLTAATFGLAAGTIAWLQKKVIFQL
jgi:ABC-type polysaccharide/polyol phosphate export permease